MKGLWLLLPLLGWVLSGCTSPALYSSYQAAGAGTVGTGTDYQAPVIVPPGFIYQRTKAPLDINFASTNVRPGKTGTASVNYIHIWPIITGASTSFVDRLPLDEAIRRGGISTVHHADYELFNVLGVFTQFTVYAYGE